MAIHAGPECFALSLCAGYGGLDLGLAIAEPQTRVVGYVERDAHAAAALVARMEDAALDRAPVWDDLTTFEGRSWRGVVDIVAAGYPCQPFSSLGLKRGAADPRHLWPHVARIVRECAPQWVFIENVEGHVDLGLAAVATELRAMGFCAKAGLFSAAEIGAPHWRRRLFVLAHADRADRRKFVPLPHRRNRLSLRGRAGQRIAGRHQERSRRVERDGDVLARRRRMAGRAIPANAISLFPPAPGNLPAWSRVLAQRPELEPAICGLADGMASGMDRLHGAGNGVCPLEAALAFAVLKADFELEFGRRV